MRILAAFVLLIAALAHQPAMGQETPAASTRPAGDRPAWGKPIKTEIQPGQMVSYPALNRDIQAYFVVPRRLVAHAPSNSPPDAPPSPSSESAEEGSPKYPSILYIHDIFGMTDFARAQVDDLARQGYAVLMPNLYSRVERSEKGFDAQNAWVAYEKTPDPQMKQDLLAAIEFLHGEGKATAGEPLAIVGHDMGGILAMLVASSDLRVTAAVNYYGRVLYANTTPMRPNSPVEDLFNLRAPMLSFYGDADPQVPTDQVKALESRLAQNPNRIFYQVVRYPGVGHGFLVPRRQGYDLKAAADSQEKVRDFLAKYLRAEPKKEEE